MPARKRKLQDDDEPLVPHGLVAQALEPVEADSSNSTSVEDSRESTQEPGNDRNQDPRLPKPPRSTAAANPAKPSSGQLLPWPKVKQQLGEGRARLTAAFPAFRALPKQISDQVARMRAKLQGSQHLGRVSAFATSRVSQVREELKSVREHAIPELQKVRDSAQVSAKVARLKQGIATTATNSRQGWREWRTNAAPRIQTMRQGISAGAKNRIVTLKGWKASAAPHFQAVQQYLSTGIRSSIEILGVWKADATPYVQSAKQRVSAGAKRSIEEGRGRIAKAAERARARKESQPLRLRSAGIAEPQKSSIRDFRLRIRLAGLPLQMRLAIARAKLEWQLGHESVSRDSRLWSSVALGALAALLVMGLFSMARHLAQASLPSNRVSANSSREATESARSASILPQTLTPAEKPAKNASRRVRPENPVLKTAAKPRVRRSGDSDYVAKDTYVYYGSRASK